MKTKFSWGPYPKKFLISENLVRQIFPKKYQNSIFSHLKKIDLNISPNNVKIKRFIRCSTTRKKSNFDTFPEN